MPSCIAPCDINCCNAVASNPRLFILYSVLIVHDRTFWWDARSACLSKQCICMHCIASWQYQGPSACVGTMHAQACMHATHTRAHVCKCTPKSSRTSWIFHCLVEIPYPQPNIEIRKPSIELKFTLISVTICSLIFFICTPEVFPGQGTRSIPGRACGVPRQV